MNSTIALVMGASRGIGSAVAAKLADEHFVILNYHRSRTQAAGVLDDIRQAGGDGALLQGDASDYGGMCRLFSEIKQKYGRLDVLAYCSGIMHDAGVEEMEVADWEMILDVNLKGAFICAKLALPLLRKSRAGRIINISSQAAFTGSRSHAHYAASKAGVLGFSYSLAKEVGAYGITVNVVSPGRIETDMIEGRKNGREEQWRSSTPMGRLGSPEEVADVVAYLASPGASYITGANINVNGGMLMG